MQFCTCGSGHPLEGPHGDVPGPQPYRGQGVVPGRPAEPDDGKGLHGFVSCRSVSDEGRQRGKRL